MGKVTGILPPPSLYAPSGTCWNGSLAFAALRWHIRCNILDRIKWMFGGCLHDLHCVAIHGTASQLKKAIRWRCASCDESRTQYLAKDKIDMAALEAKRWPIN